jgi:phosphoribosyl 1,2-cyclic phosphodiesterase
MRLRFLGTRGEIEGRTRLHRRQRVRPQAIVLTHAHSDHAGGLRDGAPCPVHATALTWRALGRYPVAERREVRARKPFELGAIRFEAFAVEHSIRAPTVGYRIEAGRAAVFYAPDVVSIRDQAAALAEVDIYIGDGAAIVRSIVRRRDGRPIGHASIRAQLDWCAAAGVPRAIFTHCGSQIVLADARETAAQVEALGRERSVRTQIAHDGLELTLR